MKRRRAEWDCFDRYGHLHFERFLPLQHYLYWLKKAKTKRRIGRHHRFPYDRLRSHQNGYLHLERFLALPMGVSLIGRDPSHIVFCNDFRLVGFAKVAFFSVTMSTLPIQKKDILSFPRASSGRQR